MVNHLFVVRPPGRMRKIQLFLVLFAVLHRLHGMDIHVTGGEMGLCFVAEYNRTFLFCWNIAATGALELNARHDARAGIALGMVGDVFELKWFAGIASAPFAGVPVRLAAGFIHNALPEYEYHSDSLRFLVSFDRRRWGVAAGPVFRFSSFFGEQGAFNPDVAVSWSFHTLFIDNEILRLGLRIANFNDFVSRNMGSHFYGLSTLVRLSGRIALVNEVEIRQSGSSVLASNFHGVLYRGGLLFLW